jgi:hypothetical protein
MFRLLVPAALLVLVSCTPTEPGPDGGSVACPTPSGSGTTHSTWPTASETWAAADGPHKVTADYRIAAGQTLTLEPCAEVLLSSGVHLDVQGKVVGQGTATKPIRIAAAQASQPFGAINVTAPGSLELSFTNIANGGSDTITYGAIDARGDQLLPVQPILKLREVAITGSVQYGVSLRGGAGFTADSANLAISGSGKAPVRTLPRMLTNLPSGSYTGNAQDVILVETEAYGDVTLEDVTVRERGVPYLVGDSTFGTFNVGTSTTPVKLTIEAGVTMKFKKNQAAGLIIDKGSMARAANGTLVAVGTSAKPIVLTSAAASPAAGDWLGVSFGNNPVAGNQMAYVEVRYAGGPSGANSFHCQPNGQFSTSEDAAVSLYGQPPSAFITNSTFASSAGAGINLAYNGSSVDMLPTNTFTAVTGCKLTTPRSATGTCPASSPCP